MSKGIAAELDHDEHEAVVGFQNISDRGPNLEARRDVANAYQALAVCEKRGQTAFSAAETDGNSSSCRGGKGVSPLFSVVLGEVGRRR
jgi:hypothetical protein